MEMKRLRYDYSYALNGIAESDFEISVGTIREAYSVLEGRIGAGSEFLGWLDLPETSRNIVPQILETASSIRESSDVLIIVGIGGSYLGARAVIDACTGFLQQGKPEIIYAGHHISGGYLTDLLKYIEGKRVAINVISKSGTTTEPALAFRVLKQWMERTYGRGLAAKRIVATTDLHRGALKKLADLEGYQQFIIPDDVGGRFSVMTPVGLLPIAAAGISIDDFVSGAHTMKDRCLTPSIETNPAFAYAAVRNALLRNGKYIEVLASFEPELQYVTEWWKQLFGESEGKEGRGIFPAAVVNTTDLHSMGQYLQDGARFLFETFLTVENDREELLIPDDMEDCDGLNYLTGKSFSYVNRKAYEATALAHSQGGMPNSTVTIPALTPHAIGELIYFFEIAVAFGGYALGINPFDQPGVENYKRNMFALLNKPGFEKEHNTLLQKLARGSRRKVE